MHFDRFLRQSISCVIPYNSTDFLIWLMRVCSHSSDVYSRLSFLIARKGIKKEISINFFSLRVSFAVFPKLMLMKRQRKRKNLCIFILIHCSRLHEREIFKRFLINQSHLYEYRLSRLRFSYFHRWSTQVIWENFIFKTNFVGLTGIWLNSMIWFLIKFYCFENERENENNER